MLLLHGDAPWRRHGRPQSPLRNHALSWLATTCTRGWPRLMRGRAQPHDGGPAMLRGSQSPAARPRVPRRPRAWAQHGSDHRRGVAASTPRTRDARTTSERLATAAAPAIDGAWPPYARHRVPTRATVSSRLRPRSAPLLPVALHAHDKVGPVDGSLVSILIIK